MKGSEDTADLPEKAAAPFVELQIITRDDDSNGIRQPGRDCWRCKGMMFRRPGCQGRGEYSERHGGQQEAD